MLRDGDANLQADSQLLCELTDQRSRLGVCWQYRLSEASSGQDLHDKSREHEQHANNPRNGRQWAQKR